MKISVVVVTLNAAKVLEETLKSIFSQDYPHYEVILIDGGSTDKTLPIVKAYDDRIEKWISEADCGIYDAMNKGVLLSTGEYVVFMNAGDRFHDSASISSVIADVPNAFDGVFYGSHIVSGRRCKKVVAKDAANLWKGMVCCHQSMFFNRSLFFDNKYSLSYGTAGDFELIFRLYSKGVDFVCFPGRVVSIYSSGGVSDKRRFRSLFQSFKISTNYSKKSRLLVCAYYAFRITREAFILFGKNSLRIKSSL